MSKRMPKGWKKVKLEEVAEVIKKTWNNGDEKLPYIGLEHINEKSLNLNCIGNSLEVTSNKFIFTEAEFLFGKLRPYFRKLYKPKFKGVCSTDIWVIRPMKNTSKDFLFYLFANYKFVHLATNSSSGTRMPRAEWNFMKKTEWLIPESIEEQLAIAEVLSSLDDKIDLLHRQNKTLEHIAETIFRKYFQQPSPQPSPRGRGGIKSSSNFSQREKDKEGEWEEKPLKDIYIFEKGFEPGSKNYLEEKGLNTIRFIRVGDMLNPNANIYIKKELAQKLCENSDLLVSFDGTVGRVVFGLAGAYSSGIRKIYSDNPIYNNLGLKYLIFKSKDIQDLIKSHATGTVILHASSSIDYLTFSFPPKSKLKHFIEIINPIFDKIKQNQTKVHTLEQLRDTLLPKLMSGEVRVKGYG